jgi:hypothetical protein
MQQARKLAAVAAYSVLVAAGGYVEDSPGPTQKQPTRPDSAFVYTAPNVKQLLAGLPAGSGRRFGTGVS